MPIIALALVGLLAGGVYSLINPEFEIMMLFAFASVPIIIAGLLLGWLVHTKLDNDGYL